jgi:hypothetical protein
MTIIIENKKILNKLNEISKNRHKNIEEVIEELVNNYEDSKELENDYIEKYRKLDPLKHSINIKYENLETDDLENIHPFTDIDDVVQFSKKLRNEK